MGSFCVFPISKGAMVMSTNDPLISTAKGPISQNRSVACTNYMLRRTIRSLITNTRSMNGSQAVFSYMPHSSWDIDIPHGD